jgi:hypothetical protein
MFELGVDQGTVVISDKAVDGLLRPFYELVSTQTKL